MLVTCPVIDREQVYTYAAEMAQCSFQAPVSLGAGACNEVKLCTYKDARGEESTKVFKAEIPARRGLDKLTLSRLGYASQVRVAQINVATAFLADTKRVNGEVRFIMDMKKLNSEEKSGARKLRIQPDGYTQAHRRADI